MNPLPIGFAFRLYLRGRLTPGGLALPGKPWAIGEEESHLLYRYSCRHSHLYTLQRSFRYAFTAEYNAHLLPALLRIRVFGVILSPIKFSAQ